MRLEWVEGFFRIPELVLPVLAVQERVLRIMLVILFKSVCVRVCVLAQV